jgi:hypothetical protein
MSEAWDEALYSKADQKKLAAVCAVLADRFPGVSGAVLGIQGRQLLATAETAGDLVTRRADDEKALRKLARLLNDADAVMQGLSRFSREVFQQRAYMEGMRCSFDHVAAIATSVAVKVPDTPFHSRENVRAIFLVEDARRVWSTNTAKEAPPGGLNPESPFAAFLTDLFAALSVGSEPRSAFQAWQKYRDSGLF